MWPHLQYVDHLLFIYGFGDRHNGGGTTVGGCYGSAQVHVEAQVSKAGFFDKLFSLIISYR